MQRSATAKSLNTILLYFNRTDAVPFQKKLEHLTQKHPEFHMTVIVREPVMAEKIISLAMT